MHLKCWFAFSRHALLAFSFALLVMSGVVMSGVTAQGAVLIDFEAFPGPDGELGTADDVPIVAPSLFNSQSVQITTEFSSLGIIFLPDPSVNNKNEILNDSSFVRTAGSSPNMLTTLRSSFPSGPVEARFTVPVFEVSMAIGLGDLSSVQPNLLEIFDSSGLLLDSIVGSDEVVTLSSLSPIARFLVTATSSSNQAAIDDVRFSAVPEPGTFALIAFVSLGVFATRRVSLAG